MNDDRAFERAMHDWLETGSDRTPTPAIAAVLLAIRTTPQEWDRRILRRTNHMSMPIRLAAGVAIVAILGYAALSFTDQRPGLGSTPSATPSATPTATPAPAPSTIDTSGWIDYTSNRYGFTIGHPAGWTEQPADHDWSLPADADWRSTGAEAFIGPTLRISAWSVREEPGTSVEAWIRTYCPESTTPCEGFEDRAVAANLDGHAGLLVPFAEDTQAFFFIGRRMYVVAAWRSGHDQDLEAVLSTMRLLPAPIDTTTWDPYTSDRYGFSIGHPADWTVHPADRDWAVPTDGMTSATEGFLSANEDVLISAWSLPVAPGTVLTTWVETYCLASTEPCTGIEERAEAATVDGHPAVLVPFASDIQAFALVDDRIFILAAWRRESWYVTDGVQLRQYFDAYLSTVRLLDGPASG